MGIKLKRNIQKQKQTHVLVDGKLVPIKVVLQRAQERDQKILEWKNQLRNSKRN